MSKHDAPGWLGLEGLPGNTMTLHDEEPLPPPALTPGEGLGFRVSCVPPKTTHHHKRIVRIGRFSRLADKPELVASKAMLDSVLLPYQPAAPIQGAVVLELAFTWPWLSTHSRKVRARRLVPHTSRPDCSNVAKTLEDRLVALRFIEDDNAVVELRVTKFWGEDPGITVTITKART